MGKYDKYICTQLRKREMLPGPNPAERDKIAAEGLRLNMEHVLWIDREVIPGAYYGETVWFWPQSYPNQISPEELKRRTFNAVPMFPHVHDFPELLTWWGTDPDHPEDTSTMGMIMGDEEIPLDTSFMLYIPAGMEHMPTRPAGGRITNKPVYHFSWGPGGSYNREKDDSVKKVPDKKEASIKTYLKTGELKNARYAIYGYKQGIKRPAYMRQTDPRYSRPVAYIDQTVVPDAEFGCDTMWLLPGNKSKAGEIIMDAYTLPHGTSITFASENYKDITDLCAEAELWIGGEKHIINKSFGAYIPPDVEQGPIIIRNITQKIYFMMSYPIGEGIPKYRGGK